MIIFKYIVIGLGALCLGPLLPVIFFGWAIHHVYSWETSFAERAKRLEEQRKEREKRSIEFKRCFDDKFFRDGW